MDSWTEEGKTSVQVTCIESQSIVVEDKQNYYYPLSVSVTAHSWRVIQTHALILWSDGCGQASNFFFA